MYRRIVLAAPVAMGLAACTFTPHELQVKPTVDPTVSDIGNGTRVYFRFVDERDDVVIGHRGVATVGAKISSSDLPGIIDSQLRQSLTKKQFQLTDAESAGDAEVTYRLRSFKFDIESGFFTGGQNASAALAVDAKRGDRTYTTVYRYNSEERILFVPAGVQIDNQMNAALNQILGKADADESLTHLLAGKP